MVDGLVRARVAVVGPGRLGGVLAAGCVRAGLRLVAVAGRGGAADPAARALAARHAGVRVRDGAADAVGDADLVLLCVPDDVLPDLVTEVARAGAWRDGQRVVHVSGASGTAPLERARLAGARVAACHPAQTFPSGPPDPDVLAGVRWAVTCATADRGWAHELVTLLGGDASDVSEDARVRYHAALVLGSNAVGGAVAVARALLLSARVDDPAGFLAPLVDASVANVLQGGAQALTGPVVRGDAGTLQRHLAALDADAPHLAAAYRALQGVVLAQVRPALDAAAVAALEAALAPVGPAADVGGPSPTAPDTEDR